MTDYLKQTLKTDLCMSFVNSFAADSGDNYFLFLGRPSAWTSPYDDNNPPPTSDTLSSDLEAWRNMLALAKINKNNVIVGATRYDWEYNSVFDQFDDAIDLFEEGNERRFYCMTDDYNVYKCISNNYGTASTIKPTAVTSEEQITADGYVWKFLFKIREELYDFVTTDFIPIEKLENIIFNDERTLQNNVRIAATPSSIDNVYLYQIGGSYPLAITKDISTESKHTLTSVNENVITVFPSEDLDRTNDIYNQYYELYIAEGPGAGSKSVITDYAVSEDDVITITLEDVLDGITTESVYRIYPRVKITGDGSNASVIPVMNDEKIITGFTILNGGTNYHYATIDVYRKNASYATKTLARAILSPVYGHGYDAIRELGSSMVMVFVPLRNAEKTVDPDAATILANDYRQIGIIKNAFYNVDGDLTPITTPDALKSFIEIENANSKSYVYVLTTDDIETILPVGSLVTQGSDANAYQARGYVESITVSEDTGTPSIITITNTNGRFLASSSTTYPLVNGSTETELSGSISGVVVTDIFDNETFLVDNYIIGTTTASTAKITQWECDPYGLSGTLYLTDIKGQFRNSYYSKNSNGEIVLVRGEKVVGYSSINPETGQLEGTSPSTVGIIKSIGSVEAELKQFYKVTTTLNIQASSGTLASDLFEVDDLIQNSSEVQATVISYTLTSNTTAVLEVTGLTGAFAVGEVLTLVEDTNTVTNASISSIESPEVLPYYGDMIYIQNVTPITASNDSEEHIKLIIKF